MEYCPKVSTDGKYLFFTSGRSGNGDIYWVDAGFIQNLKPKES
jgi:Tol biopolymer transport system component